MATGATCVTGHHARSANPIVPPWLRTTLLLLHCRVAGLLLHWLLLPRRSRNG
jgi:hypothetical protein